MCKDLGNNVFECNGNCGGGTVWGTGIYTSDSNLYLAAKHMGYLPGIFTKIPGPALQGFIGTIQNGVTTCNYGSYGSTFYLHKGVFDTAKNNQIIETQLKSFQTQITAFTKLQQNLSTMVKHHQASLNKILAEIQKREKQLMVIQQKIETDSKFSSNLNELKTNMAELYISEMKKYNQNINILIQKDCLLCSVCCQKKREAILTPCSHAHFCKDCVKVCIQKGKCPICQVQITGFQFIKFQ